MPGDFGSLLAIVVCFALTFIVARTLGARWRARRKARSEQATRAGESRQVRRARGRKAR